MSATEKRNTVDTVAWNKQINWKLPMEMLERVFQFLAPKDLKTARLVCKHWKEVAEIPTLWTWTSMEPIEWEFSVLLLMINLDMLRCVEAITYSSGNWPVDRDSQHALLQGIVRHPGLKVITMTNIDVSEVDHELLAKALVKLEMVDISGTAMTALQKETLFSALENQN